MWGTVVSFLASVFSVVQFEMPASSEANAYCGGATSLAFVSYRIFH